MYQPTGRFGRTVCKRSIAVIKPSQQNPPVSVILMQQPLVARCSEIVGMVVLFTAQPEGLAARVPGVLVLPHVGWQRDASSFLEQFFLDSALPMTSARCSAPKEALCGTPFHRNVGQPSTAVRFRHFFACSALSAAPQSSFSLVHSTALAITVQVVRWQVCWGGGVMHWSLRHVVKLELECPQMCSCEMWIWLGSASKINDAEGSPIFCGV